MVNVAREMERRGLDLPLLIGGATTSKQHTAVKIAPEYERPVVHVLDASRVVGVVSDLLDPERARGSTARTASCRSGCASSTPRRSASRCCRSRRRARTRQRSTSTDLPTPAFTGRRVVEPDLETLVRYIDWQFFFHAWELKGKYPAILEQPAARELYDDAARAPRADRVEPSALQARGRLRLLAGARDGDDVVLEDEARVSTSCASRPAYGDSRPNRSLADFVAPSDDHIGAFAVSIHGADELAARYEAEHDDYHAIMVKALADRLAEAFAEYLHEQARREWYETDEELSSEDLIAERYRGIRPAFGYPACPDHTEKRTLFDAPRRRRGRPRADRELRDAPGRGGLRDLPRPPRGPLLLRRPDRARPGRGLRRPQGLPARGGRAVAGAEPRLRRPQPEPALS